jgi:hypothetical protein
MIKNKKMRRKIPVFRVTMAPGVSYSVLTETPEIVQIVIDETIVAIKEGIAKKKKSILLFEVANSDYYIELEKDKWKSSLENALEYYVEKEEYNKCIECRDLINQL